MTDINIYEAGGTLLMSVPITESAEHTIEIGKADNIILSWRSTTLVQIPMGAFITYNGINYVLINPYLPEMKNAGEYEYKPQFDNEIFSLSKYPFVLCTTNTQGQITSIESDWNFTGSKEDFAIVLSNAIKNALGTDYDVEFDETIDGAVSQAFGNLDIISAINNVASAWQAEWWTDKMINGSTGSNTIHFGKMCIHEGGETEPFVMESGVNVESPSTKSNADFYNRFYVFGATRNISQDYNGAMATQIVNKRLTLNPTWHPEGFIDLPEFTATGELITRTSPREGYAKFWNWNTQQIAYYKLDASLTNTNKRFSKVIQDDEVYPRADLKVTNVQYITNYRRDEQGNKIVIGGTDAEPIYDTYRIYFFQLLNSSDVLFTINKSYYNPDTNPTGAQLKNLDPSIHFKSGALTGREFKVNYYDSSDTKRGDVGEPISISAGTWEIIIEEDGDLIIPNANIEPDTNDEATIFNIRMPDEYILAGQKELEEKAFLDIYENTKDNNAYTIKTNKVYFAENQPIVNVGRHVTFKYGGRVLDTRVTKIVTKLDHSFERTFTLSKQIQKGTISTLLTTIEATNQKVIETHIEDTKDIRDAKRNAYIAQNELKSMIFNPDGSLSPDMQEKVETMMLSVGAMSTNFQLRGIIITPNVVSGTAVQVNVLATTAGYLDHFGINPDEVITWSFNAQTINQDRQGNNLVNATAYYLYARCARNGSGGTFVLDSQKRQFDYEDNYYNFLVGVLSSVLTQNSRNYRIMTTTYGNTTINGNQIKTGRISSIDGNTYFDLDSGTICGTIKFINSQHQEVDAQTYIDNSITTGIDNIEIGGRNLLSTTSTPKTMSIYSGNVGMRAYDYTTYGIEVIANVAVGDNMIVSFDYDASKACSIGVNLNSVSGQTWNNYSPTIAVQAGKGHFVGKIPIKAVFTAQIPCPFFYFTADTTSGNCVISNVKLEVGNKATDWTMAPEDEEIGGRNLLLNSKELNAVLPSSSFNQYNLYVSPTFRWHNEKGTASGRTKVLHVHFSYKIDNWNGSHYPAEITIGGQASGDAWSRRIQPSSVEALSSTTKLYYGSVDIQTTDWNIGYIYDTEGLVKILCESSYRPSGSTGNVAIRLYDLKIETGTIRTDWTPAPEDSEYITQQLLKGDTTINGGLIMTGQIQATSNATSSGNVTAGINGVVTDATRKEDVAMWAGGTFDEATRGVSPFRVLHNGHVDMNDVNVNSRDVSGNNVSIENGKIVIKNSSNVVLTELSQGRLILDKESALIDPIQLQNAALISKQFSVPSYNSVSINETRNYGEVTMTENGQTSEDFTLTASMQLSVGAFASVYQTIHLCVFVKKNGFTVNQAIAQGVVFEQVTATLNVGSGLKFSFGDVLTFGYSVTGGCASLTGSATTITINTTSTTTSKNSIPCIANNYFNKLLSNGLLISKGSNYQMGFQADDNNSHLQYILNYGNFMSKLVNAIMWFKEGGSDYYRQNPLVLIVRLNYSANSYTQEIKYNPKNLRTSISRESTGLITITHNIGHTNYSVMGAGIDTNGMAYVCSQNRQANQCQVTIQDDDSRNDKSVDVFFYDYSKIS